MGAGLFERFPGEVAVADEILGYSIEELCLRDEHGRLDQTQFTQPALFVVNALHFLERTERGERPDYVAGHSLGSYDALYAAGAFDFATGVRLVQRRGQLMAQASGGGMAAVIGLTEVELRAALERGGFSAVDVANLNTPIQIVISGPREEVERAAAYLSHAVDAHIIMLRVSGAFHSRYMAAAEREFLSFLRTFRFGPLRVPVLSNAFAVPYDDGFIAETLAAQMTRPVRWTEIVRHLLELGPVDFVEVGPGRTLSAMIRQVKLEAAALERQMAYDAKAPTKSMVPPPVESGIVLTVDVERSGPNDGVSGAR
jgi:trans-AT polyketide synthase/acyltransferase/oxidoreductase domain-containing protein